jgi:hypothetical protein
MRDPLDPLKGIGADRPAPTVTDTRSEPPVSRWSDPPGPDWRDRDRISLPWDQQLKSTLLARSLRAWLPLVALGIIAMIGLVATTPEAYAERTPTSPIHGHNLKSVPHRR